MPTISMKPVFAPRTRAALLRLGVHGHGLDSGSTALSDDDIAIVRTSTSRALAYPPGYEFDVHDLMREPRLVVTGWVALSRGLSDGRRQIVDIFLPGDLIAGCTPDAPVSGSYHCLTEARCCDIGDITRHADSGRASATLVANLHTMEREFQARLIECVVRLGRMLSHERLAHLALDLYRRHERVGMLIDRGFAMPLTQETVGDVLGMSTVHVSRTMQLLRKVNALVTMPGHWQVPDAGLLAEYAAGKLGRQGGREY